MPGGLGGPAPPLPIWPHGGFPHKWPGAQLHRLMWLEVQGRLGFRQLDPDAPLWASVHPFP
jgi:hypothetical protein